MSRTLRIPRSKEVKDTAYLVRSQGQNIYETLFAQYQRVLKSLWWNPCDSNNKKTLQRQLTLSRTILTVERASTLCLENKPVEDPSPNALSDFALLTSFWGVYNTIPPNIKLQSPKTHNNNNKLENHGSSMVQKDPSPVFNVPKSYHQVPCQINCHVYPSLFIR